MFPNISEQDFYRACIDQIFEAKKIRGEFRPSDSRHQREYHQLRLYFNRIMHSTVDADEKGYLTAVEGVSSLINFCSQIEIPTNIYSIYSYADIKSPSRKLSKKNKEKSDIHRGVPKTDSPTVYPTPPTLCIIVDRRSKLSNKQLLEIENGITAITKNAEKDNWTIIVFTIKSDSSVLTFPIFKKKIRFSFNGTSEDEQIKPLRDYLYNLKPDVQYHFYLTNASKEKNYRLPISLNESSLLMNIGIVENGLDSNLSHTRQSSCFDKLILESKLPSFFDWLIKIINNE